MKKYVGKKTVEAEAVAYGDWAETTSMGSDEYPADTIGYRVRFSDNSETWIPSSEFNLEYSPIDTYLDRLRLESKEMGERADRLKTFIDGELFNALANDTKTLLNIQLDSMNKYLAILGLRYGKAMGWDYDVRDASFDFILPFLVGGYAIRRACWREGVSLYKPNPEKAELNKYRISDQLPKEIEGIVSDKVVNYGVQYMIKENGESKSWKITIDDAFAHDWELVK